jgi:hypothetical protein
VLASGPAVPAERRERQLGPQARRQQLGVIRIRHQLRCREYVWTAPRQRGREASNLIAPTTCAQISQATGGTPMRVRCYLCGDTSFARSGTVTMRPERRNAHPVAIQSIPSSRENHMNRRKPTYFRNSLDLRDKVQVKVLRKRLKLSDEQFASVVRKSGSSISAIAKEAATLK